MARQAISFEREVFTISRELAKATTVPKNLRRRIEKGLAKDPRAAWDEALHRLAR